MDFEGMLTTLYIALIVFTVPIAGGLVWLGSILEQIEHERKVPERS